MRKLIISAVLSFFAVAAFAQDAATTDVSTAGASSQPNVVESAAQSFGNFLGRMVKGPVDVVKAVASGVSEGYSGKTQPAAAAASSNSTSSQGLPAYVAPTTNTASQADGSNAMADKLAAVRSQVLSLVISKQAPAPVEDRSVPASTSN